MKRALLGTFLLVVGFGAVRANEADLGPIKKQLAEALNTVLEASYNQGFIDGYKQALADQHEAQVKWEKTHV